MGKTNITHSLQARTMKPNSCMCKTGFAQKVINLFTNAIIENSHPARLEMKPNPLAHSECPDLQNCALSSSFPQLPTNKMLPKPPPPLQPHFNDCAYGICHAGPKATFNSRLRYAEPGPHLGHSRMCPAEQAPSQGCTWPSSGMPCTGGPRGRQPVILSLGGSLRLSTAWEEQTASPAGSPAPGSLVCKLPSKGKCLGRHSSNNIFSTTHEMSISCLYCPTAQKSQVAHIPPVQHLPQHLHSPRSKLHNWPTLGRLNCSNIKKTKRKSLRNPF